MDREILEALGWTDVHREDGSVRPSISQYWDYPTISLAGWYGKGPGMKCYIGESYVENLRKAWDLLHHLISNGLDAGVSFCQEQKTWTASYGLEGRGFQLIEAESPQLAICKAFLDWHKNTIKKE